MIQKFSCTPSRAELRRGEARSRILEIQDRDLKVLKFIFENRVASIAQVQRALFAEDQRSIASRRLFLLYRAELIERDGCVRGTRLFMYYRVSEKGFELIRNAWDFDIDRPYLKSESPWHDMQLVNIRFELERLERFDSIFQENLLSSSKDLRERPGLLYVSRLNPDAALFLKRTDGGTDLYAVEYEGSKKAPDRYADKIRNYYEHSGVDGVLYICSERQTINSLARVDAEVRGQGPSLLYLAHERDVLGFREEMRFRNVKTGELILQDRHASEWSRR